MATCHGVAYNAWVKRLIGYLALAFVVAGCAGTSSTPITTKEPKRTGGLAYSDLPAGRKAVVDKYPTQPASSDPTPATFDGRTFWLDANGNSCLTPAWDQGNTEFCWAFSSSTMISDRFRIAHASDPTGPFFSSTSFPAYSGGGKWDGPTQTVLNGFAPIAVGECSISGSTLGCSQTGDPTEALDFLYTSGGPLFQGWGVYICAGACPNLTGVSRYTVGEPYAVTPRTGWSTSNPVAIMNEIKKHGPVATYIRIAPQFDSWWESASSATDVFGPDDTGGNMYNDAANAAGLGGHIVVIVGWGTSAAGEDYWIIRNSWGQMNADQGYFLLNRGSNFVYCETFVTAAKPGTDTPVGS